MDEMARGPRLIGDLARSMMDQAVAASMRYPQGQCITCGTEVKPILVDGYVISAYVCAACEKAGC
jgi:DNA-directed RNA polymerase subunit RPC12/RpoP